MTTLLRTGSFFRKKQAHGYQSWTQEEPDGLLGDEPGPARPLNSPDSALEEKGRIDIGVGLSDLDRGFSLVECFYLGAVDMEGRSVRGRGCIDSPAGELWQQTQEEGGFNKKLRKSLRGSTKLRGEGTASLEENAATTTKPKPRYVELVAVKNALEMRDAGTGETLATFLYCAISFVGTHPKYNRLFAFVAYEKGKKVTSCYAFKCEDKSSACATAKQLDEVFHQRCTELSRKENKNSPCNVSSSSLVAVVQ